MCDFLQVLHIRLSIPLIFVFRSVRCPRSGSLLYCVRAFKGNTYVGLSEEVSYLPNLGTMVCKVGPFFVVIPFCIITFCGIICAFVCICFSSLVMVCFGNLLLLGMSCILIHSVFLFSKDNGRAVILLIR